MAILTAGLCATAPVCGSHAHPCHGHTTLPSRITPVPSGPPRWMQTLSIAEMVPPTLATHTILSPSGNSLALPGSGNSALLQSFFIGDLGGFALAARC